MKKLSIQEVGLIRDFVKSKYVDYYDVQEELVDHLALNIEGKMSEDDTLSFKEALHQAYSQFGLFGFTEFVEEKEKQTFRGGRKLFFKEFLDFFKIPQVLLTALVACFFYCAASFFNPSTFLIISLVAMSIPSVYGVVQLLRYKRDCIKKLTKADFGNGFLGGYVSILNLFNLLFNSKGDRAISFIENGGEWYMTLFASLIFVALLAQVKALRNIHSKLKSQYPEAFAKA